MSTERLFSLRNPWFTGAVAVVALIAVASAVTGFMWLPALQSNARFAGMWDAICSAAGIAYVEPVAEPVVQADYKTTDVVVTPGMLGGVSAISIGRGATFAMQCTMCHGARGLSEADSPNLAGQFAPSIFKQLRDYKSGARTSAIMSPRDNHPTTAKPAPQIVVSGAPMRNIPPCASCHGTLDYKTGSAWLEGQSPVYLRTQLEAFASGARHNDISQQMRNIARGMSHAEIEEAVQYYANRP
jgi:cytochrome c553